MPVKINGTTSGSVTLAAPDTGSDVTLTLPTTALATQAYADSAADDAEAAAIAGGGLVLISPTSIANSGGSASSSNGTTTFSGVSSVSLNGVFTSTYRNYKIITNVTAASATTNISMRLRVSGTDVSSASYYRALWYREIAGSFGSADTNGGNTWVILDVNSSYPYYSLSNIDIFGPQVAQPTTATFISSQTSASPTILGVSGIYLNNGSDSADGVTLTIASGNFSGIVRVYGYKGA